MSVPICLGFSLALRLAAADAAGPRAYEGPAGASFEGEPAIEVAQSDTTPAPAATEPAPIPVVGDRSSAVGGVGTRRVRVKTRARPTDPDRASSVITRRELDERLPRSAPDALRGEPGVFVQQTAHGQASVYVRGLTGQQTVLMFDGVRMNTSTFRQGPNQYFFTVDSRTVDHLEVVRGSASTRYGADALGGAILASPIEPSLERGKRAVTVHSKGIVSTTTADAQLGGRAQLDVGVLGRVGVIGGVGYRDVNQLQSGGLIRSPVTGEQQTLPPLFGPDKRTQLGTGFKELTGDVRAVGEIDRKNRVTVAYYDYRQRDAPRTDFCPEPTAPQNECLTYLKQERTLVYGKYEHHEGPAWAEQVRLTVSYQRQHEDRFLRRGDDSSTRRHGVDTVHTTGSALSIETKQFAPSSWARLHATYGIDGYYDKVRSAAKLTFVDTGTVTNDITQYTDGAKYFTSGVWAIGDTDITRILRLRLGARVAAVWAKAPYDGTRGSIYFDRYWITAVGHGGITLRPLEWLAFPFSVDQAFRAPNIDDLTSRQATGGGRQFENSRLVPEHATLLEGGIRITQPWIELAVFGFYNVISDHILRTPATRAECPPRDQVCKSASFIISLKNSPGLSTIRGVDGGIKLYLPYDFGAAATISYARGDGRNPRYGVVPDSPHRTALSRIPPLNGSVEFGWRSSEWGPYLIGAVRWARKQIRLWPTDRTDVRIPTGGTPGFVVLDLRAGYRLDPNLLLALVFENVTDKAYRHHGSSINGPGRGLLFELHAGF